MIELKTPIVKKEDEILSTLGYKSFSKRVNNILLKLNNIKNEEISKFLNFPVYYERESRVDWVRHDLEGICCAWRFRSPDIDFLLVWVEGNSILFSGPDFGEYYRYPGRILCKAMHLVSRSTLISNPFLIFSRYPILG